MTAKVRVLLATGREQDWDAAVRVSLHTTGALLINKSNGDPLSVIAPGTWRGVMFDQVEEPAIELARG